MDASMILGSIEFLKEHDREYPCSDIDSWMEEFEYTVEEVIPPEEIDLKLYFGGVQDVFTLFLLKGSSSSSVGAREEIVKNLLESLQVQQRTTEWYAQSKKLLTASEFSKILGTPRAMASLALQKATAVLNTNSGGACSTAFMSAFDWGIRFEPVVKQVLERMWECDIAEVGRFTHATDSRLAASPDGIILKAADPNKSYRLLEIKCPIRREITGTIPFEYWCQMQIQMEVTGIDECEYVEMNIMSPYKDNAYVPSTNNPPSSIWLFQCAETCELKYAYTSAQKNEMEFLGWNCLETIPWHLEKMYTETVSRDRRWFNSTKEKQEEFWRRVADAHNGLIEPPKRRPRAPSVQVCQIMDDMV